MIERWKILKDYKNYMISSLGRLYNIKFERYLKGYICNGYIYYTINKKGYRAHILVAKAFISNPNNKVIINHKDGNKQNNSIENLEWCTQKENMIHALENNLLSDNICTPIKALNIKTKEELIFNSINEAGRKGFNIGHISSCLSGKRNTHKGYIWKKI